jgi:hypothetical protein
VGGRYDFHMEDLMPFQGMLCLGVYFSSGQCISLLSWDSAPVSPPSFSQVWLTDVNGASTCYIDPPSAGDVFEFYHKFDRIIGARFDLKWSAPDRLSFRVSADDIALDVRIRTEEGAAVRCINALLRTPARKLLRSRGKTDTGKRYVHQPHRLVAIVAAEGTLNGGSLGILTSPPASLRVAGSPVQKRPMLSFCTHYLEPFVAAGQPATA